MALNDIAGPRLYPKPMYDPATLATTITAGLELWGNCKACRRDIIVTPEDLEALAERYGRDAVLSDVMARITCSVCGGASDLRLFPKGAYAAAVATRGRNL